MVTIMLKSTNNNKCCRVDYVNDYESLVEGLTNPYCYNFGRVIKYHGIENFTKLHHVINEECIDRK